RLEVALGEIANAAMPRDLPAPRPAATSTRRRATPARRLAEPCDDVRRATPARRLAEPCDDVRRATPARRLAEPCDDVRRATPARRLAIAATGTLSFAAAVLLLLSPSRHFRGPTASGQPAEASASASQDAEASRVLDA